MTFYYESRNIKGSPRIIHSVPRFVYIFIIIISYTYHIFVPILVIIFVLVAILFYAKDVFGLKIVCSSVRTGSNSMFLK